MGRPWRRALRWLLAALALAASARYLALALGPALAQARAGALSPGAGSVALALGLFTLGLALGAAAWQLVLRSLGLRLPPAEVCAAHSLSGLGKYLPGSVWPYVGKAYLTGQLGAQAGAASLAVGLELLSLILTGAALGAFCAPREAAATWGALRWARWPGAALAVGLLAALPWLAAWARSRGRGPIMRLSAWARRVTGRDPRVTTRDRIVTEGRDHGATARDPIAPLWLYAAHAAMTAGWLANGLALGALLRGLGADPPANLAPYALAWAYLAGLLVLFVPVGLGVREATLTWMLAPGVAAPQAAAAALWARLLSVAAEPLVLGLMLAWRWAARRGAGSRGRGSEKSNTE